ncbi:hypothetical protein AXF42_Ash017981 [Apostasia shenzhenica]|uniref:Uncharacterized protein n=1 Tax=Apostasia shenzhenica TaxID=1088818 RepID=A0A2I0A524_9ASPA|nr:hypothetical protein AXF42_Ash017981 [Apostasia shenzhenica]
MTICYDGNNQRVFTWKTDWRKNHGSFSRRLEVLLEILADGAIKAYGRLVCDSCCTACQRLRSVGGKTAPPSEKYNPPTVRCHVGSLFFGVITFRRLLFGMRLFLFVSDALLTWRPREQPRGRSR